MREGVISNALGREQLTVNEGLIMNETNYVMDVLLMLEISYNLRMREGAECGGSPWQRMGGDLQS